MSKIFLFFFYLAFCLFLSLILFFLPFFLKTLETKKNKMCNVEAGFFSTGKIQLSFSLQFVFLLLVFVLFDTEILFTFGFVLNSSLILKLNFFILFFLWITLFFEWKWNKLIWVVYVVNRKIE